MDFDDYVTKLEFKAKLKSLNLPTFKVFKEMYALQQTRVVEILVETEVKSKKVDNLSLDILKYAILHREKVKVINNLLNRLYKKYEYAFKGDGNNGN